jgi:hypothetical protein
VVTFIRAFDKSEAAGLENVSRNIVELHAGN